MMVAWMGWHGQGELAAEVAEHLLLGAAAGAGHGQRAPESARPPLRTRLSRGRKR